MTEPGDGLLIVGTTLACQVVVERVALDEDPVGFHLATARPDRHMRALPAMTGTVALDWVLGLTGTTHDQLSELLDATPRGARGVAALPYLSPSGERVPFVDPTARAEFTGLDLRATRADLVRAMCEAIAFAARHCLEAAGLTGRLAVCGGGARNPAWLCLFADVLGRPLRVARGPEPGARGAVLAGVAAHGDTLGRQLDVARWTAPEAVIDPDPAGVAYYEHAYADYLFRVESARNRWAGPADARGAAALNARPVVRPRPGAVGRGRRVGLSSGALTAREVGGPVPGRPPAPRSARAPQARRSSRRRSHSGSRAPCRSGPTRSEGQRRRTRCPSPSAPT